MACARSPTRSSGASEREIAVELARLKAIFGYEQAAWKTAVPVYFEALADIPADLLASAVRMLVANSRSGDRFPRPGDIRVLIADELRARRMVEGREVIALPAPGDPAPTPEEREHMLRRFAALRMRFPVHGEGRWVPESGSVGISQPEIRDGHSAGF